LFGEAAMLAFVAAEGAGEAEAVEKVPAPDVAVVDPDVDQRRQAVLEFADQPPLFFPMAEEDQGPALVPHQERAALGLGVEIEEDRLVGGLEAAARKPAGERRPRLLETVPRDANAVVEDTHWLGLPTTGKKGDPALLRSISSRVDRASLPGAGHQD